MSDGQDINLEELQELENKDMTIKYLTFNVGGQYYGISIRHVIEIVQVQPSTPLPEQPHYAKGIIRLRNDVIPVIDLNLRFGKQEREGTDRTCIIIVDIKGAFVGFIVDEVEEVLDIEDDMISPPPKFSADTENRFVTGVCRLEKYMILLLNTALIFSDSEMGMLEHMVQ